jgi:hypothetical protein
MKNKKILYIVFTIIIVIAGITTVAFYKIGDRIFNEVLDIQISELEKVMEATESNVAETQMPVQSSAQPTITTQVPALTQPTGTEQIPAKQPRGTEQIPTKQPTGSKQIPAIQPAGSTEIPATKPDATSNQDIEVTKEKLENIKGSITPSDKMTAASLVLSKLSKSDISHLTELSAGGITPEEKEKMKGIVYSRFTSEEIQKIRDMYVKYMK